MTGGPVDIWNRYEFYEHYDMERSETVSLSLSDFCNQIIHSWIWMLSATEAPSSRFDGVYVSSDRARKRHVYFMPAGRMISTFRKVGLDDIVSVRLQRDSNGDMRIVQASRVGDQG